MGINKLLHISRLNYVRLVLGQVCLWAQASVLGFVVFVSTAPAAAQQAQIPQTIHWQPWGPAAFELAQQQGKLVFLDVGIEGCTACRRMNEVTFHDPEVIATLNQHFISISVDAEARPDIGQRYSDWAWPALVFLLPDRTQILALRGNRVPANFLRVLNTQIAGQAAGTLTPDSAEPLQPNSNVLAESLQAMRLQIRGQLDSQLNEDFGSWSRSGISATSAARVRNLEYRAFMYGNPELQAITLRSAVSFLELLDPVWGGVFQAYRFPGAESPGAVVPEKRVAEQAGALKVFADAYQRTGEVRFRNAIDRVDQYLQDTLASGKGTFFTSQRGRPLNLPDHVSVERYWSLRTEHERRRFGIPPVDHAIYTDKNAVVISGYAAAFAATGEANYLQVARRAADVLLRERLTRAGWIRQHGNSAALASDERMRPLADAPRPYLHTQASMANALLVLYAVSAEERWLVAAQKMVEAMIEVLGDRTAGGFYSTEPEPDAVFPPQKPLEANALAARVLYNLSVYLQQPEYADRAVSTMRAVAQPEAIRREGKVTAVAGTTLELLAAGYVEISVVGSPQDARAQELYAEARSQYHPRKLLQFDLSGRYPDRAEPAVYICNPDFCTTPIFAPAELGVQLQAFRKPAATPYP